MKSPPADAVGRSCTRFRLCQRTRKRLRNEEDRKSSPAPAQGTLGACAEIVTDSCTSRDQAVSWRAAPTRAAEAQR